MFHSTCNYFTRIFNIEYFKDPIYNITISFRKHSFLTYISSLGSHEKKPRFCYLLCYTEKFEIILIIDLNSSLVIYYPNEISIISANNEVYILQNIWWILITIGNMLNCWFTGFFEMLLLEKLLKYSSFKTSMGGGWNEVICVVVMWI